MMLSRLRRDDGLSLAELLVAMVLLGIVLAMVTGLFVSVAKSVSQSQAVNDSTRVASNASNAMSKVIRVSTNLAVSGTPVATPAIAFAGREALMLYSNVDVSSAIGVADRPSRPTRVRFEINATSRQLTESRWRATETGRFWTFAAATTPPSSVRNLDGPFVAPTGSVSPLFTYLDSASVVVPTPASGTLSVADIKRIAFVQVTVSIGSAGGNTASTIVNTIKLLNL